MYSDAYLNRAKAYAEKGMKDEADSDYNEAIKANPDKFTSFDDLYSSESLFDDESLSEKQTAAHYIQQGIEDIKNENYPGAIEKLSEAITLSPQDAQCYMLRGQAYMELGQPDEAMVDLNRAILIDPLHPASYYWRGMVWKAMNSPRASG